MASRSNTARRTKSRRVPLALDNLETRITPAVTIIDGAALSFTASAADNIAVSRDASGKAVVTVNSTSTVLSTDAAAITSLSIQGNGNFDNVIDLSAISSAAFPLLASINANGGAGKDKLIGPAGGDISPTPYEAINLVPGTPGVASILTSTDDGFAGLDLGTNTFTFYGNNYSGATLFVDSNGLLTFGSGTSSRYNNTLTVEPAQAAIAPFFDDLTTTRNANDQVLYQFQDTTGDSIPDRLIVEWNDVYHYDTTASPITFQAILQLNTGSVAGEITFTDNCARN